MDAEEIMNPKKTMARRERDAEGGVDAGNLDGPNKDMLMSQSKFSKYPAGGKKGGPPEAFMKRRTAKE